ncbi:SpoIIE family protein phosphatase [Alphaproteobacteria bacterium]|nr:SpoIIE family protein phosphatase [Alphaproteobacteria bacterium]
MADQSPLAHAHIITGLMQHYARHGDVLASLDWALPKIVKALSAEAGSLFLHRAEERVLECVVCVGPVDIIGLKVPDTSGLIGNAHQSGLAGLVTNTQQDIRHNKTVDSKTGLKTISSITSPVSIGRHKFGAIQIINQKTERGIGAFSLEDLPPLKGLADALAIAFQNVELADQLIQDKLLQRDIEQATESQNALLPIVDPDGFAAGQILPARNLSGDFFDYLRIQDSLMFCQGDVAGKGITASILMARSISLFRHLARSEKAVDEIANIINNEFLDVISDKFVTFVVGRMNCLTGDTQIVNCGHGPFLVLNSNTNEVEMLGSQTTPLGVSPYKRSMLLPTKLNLKNRYLILATDGIVEAKAKGQELGLKRLASLTRRLDGRKAIDKVSGIMQLFKVGKLTTHDDATILVVTCPERGF